MGAIGSQVDDIAEAIDKTIAKPIEQLTDTTQNAADAAEWASTAASSAESSATNAEYEAERVHRLVADLQAVVDDIQDNSMQSLAHRVLQMRRKIWWNFAVDTFERTSAQATQLERRLRELLSADVSLDAARNSWELRVWEDILKDRKSQRGGRGTQKWWDQALQEVASFMANPAYAAPELPDLRAALQADLDHEVDDPESVTQRFKKLVDAE